eukprot:TRINITY_DN10875_c0_g2_i1.p1 TRINITY_DN10875_c0_g2~~TRINITY_DN10875_c0_g2_i1.p1  ORF type:complete len:245 (+),score=99.86 TRINITY_DN10875_c0_g2_i1:64-735(+)
MARRGVLQQLRIDPTVGWVALLLGVAALYLYIRDRRRRDVDRRAAPRAGDVDFDQGALGGGGPPAAGADGDGVRDYCGWKVLVNLEAVRTASAADGGLRVDETQVEVLHHLAGVCELHTLMRVDSDAEEELARLQLEELGLVKSGLRPHRMLFADSMTGMKAVGRQLTPSLLIDSSREIVDYLAPHLPHVGYVCVEPGPGNRLLANTIVAPTVAEVLKALTAG